MSVAHRVSDTKKTIEFSTSEDRLKLFMSLTCGPDASTIGDGELVREISVLSPLDLIDTDVVSDIEAKCRRGEGCVDRRVAKGIAMVPGRDGKLVWLVRRFNLARDHEEVERGFSDFFHLGLFENVKTGQEVARWYKPKPGAPGKDVFGKQIPPSAGKPSPCKLDKTLSLRAGGRADAYDLIISEANGYVREESGNLSVREVLEIPGNVDYSIGHVDFIGAVIVRGDVQKGFNVRARRSLEIHGAVLGDNVLASSESVTVRGFHNGGERAVVYAGTDYIASVAHHLRVEAKGNIKIAKEALDCSLRSAAAIFSPQANIQGGTAWAVQGIEVKNLGNESGIGTKTELHNQGEVTEEFEQLHVSAKKHRAAMATLELHLGPYAVVRTRVQLLKGAFRDKITGLLQKYDSLHSSLITIERRLAALSIAPTEQVDARVNGVEKIFAGVELSSKGVVHVVKDSLTGPIGFTVVRDEVTGESRWITVEFKSLQRKEK